MQLEVELQRTGEIAYLEANKQRGRYCLIYSDVSK